MANNKVPVQIDNLLLKLNEEQLRGLNNKVIERIKLIHRAKSAVSMSRFNVGDRVYFIHEGRKLMGRIIRLNPRTVTINLDNGHQWRIAPSFLTKVLEPEVEIKTGRNEPRPCGSGKKYKKCCG